LAAGNESRKDGRTNLDDSTGRERAEGVEPNSGSTTKKKQGEGHAARAIRGCTGGRPNKARNP